MPKREEISLPLGKGNTLPAVFDWSSTSVLARSPDLVAVCGFSLIGLFTWLVLAMQFPFTDEMVAQLAQF